MQQPSTSCSSPSDSSGRDGSSPAPGARRAGEERAAGRGRGQPARRERSGGREGSAAAAGSEPGGCVAAPAAGDPAESPGTGQQEPGSTTGSDMSGGRRLGRVCRPRPLCQPTRVPTSCGSALPAPPGRCLWGRALPRPRRSPPRRGGRHPAPPASPRRSPPPGPRGRGHRGAPAAPRPASLPRHRAPSPLVAAVPRCVPSSKITAPGGAGKPPGRLSRCRRASRPEGIELLCEQGLLRGAQAAGLPPSPLSSPDGVKTGAAAVAACPCACPLVEMFQEGKLGNLIQPRAPRFLINACGFVPARLV